jgi:hypothetical protein
MKNTPYTIRVLTPRERQIDALKNYMLAAAIGIGMAAVMVFGWGA